MADHGENMEPESHGHGKIAFTHKKLYEGVSHTPLIIRLPGQTGGARISALTQNIDVAPTLIELLGLPGPPEVEGRSLVPLMRDRQAHLHEEVFIESSDGIEKAVKTLDLKYIHRGEGEDPLVFDWRNDRDEKRNLLGKVPDARVGKLRQAVDEYGPETVLHIRLLPAGGPYKAGLDLRLSNSPIDVAACPEPYRLSDDRQTFQWSGEVKSRVVDIELMPRHRKTEMRWWITHSGTDHPERMIWLGKTPLSETTAIPVWMPGEGSPSPAPQVSILRSPEDRTLKIEVQPDGGQPVILELRHAKPSYGDRLELLSSAGFSSLTKKSGQVYELSSTGGGRASATLKSEQKGENLYALIRAGGRWPDPQRVVVDGCPAVTEPLEFVFPHPSDGRLSAVLRSGIDTARAPRGTIMIWMESSGGGPEIDPITLDAELVEQLRALGYVK
jgi:hypothetical protein